MCQVQIIFTATNDAADRKGPPVKHLLAIAREGDEAKTRKALDDWYLAPAKDYSLFAAKHPLNDSLDMQSEHLEKMDRWCRTIQIKHTPTYFLNGYELPQIYQVGDLDYFLKS